MIQGRDLNLAKAIIQEWIDYTDWENSAGDPELLLRWLVDNAAFIRDREERNRSSDRDGVPVFNSLTADQIRQLIKIENC